MKHKNWILGTMALFGATVLTAQDIAINDVPENLKNTFEKTYPKAKYVEWERKAENYKVEFDQNRKDHEVYYNTDGTILRTETEITKSDLPKVIKNTISNNYKGYKIDSIELKEENGAKTYEVELNKAWDTEKQVVFDSSGKVISEKND